MKRVILALLVLSMCFSLCACGGRKEATTIKNFDEIYNSVKPAFDSRAKYLLSDLESEGVVSLDYTINNIVKNANVDFSANHDGYNAFVIVNVETDGDLSKSEKSIITTVITRDFCNVCGYQNKYDVRASDNNRVSTYGADEKISSVGCDYSHITLFIDGEMVVSAEDNKEEAYSKVKEIVDNVDISGGNGTKCRACGRSYTDNTNIISIKKTNMCENCYQNYRVMSEAVKIATGSK